MTDKPKPGSTDDATHRIELVPSQQNEPGAIKLKLWRLLPFAKQSNLECDLCGAAIPVPYGNIESYVQELAHTLGTDLGYFRMRIEHRFNVKQLPGTVEKMKKSHAPAGAPVKMHLTKEEIEALKPYAKELHLHFKDDH